MAGKQQHFVPQFLQKGFSSRTSKSEHYVWVYRKGREPFNPNTKGIGQERYFYSDGKETEIDDAITGEENEFAVFCDQIRNNPSAITNLNYQAPRLMAHLEVRSKNIRDSFISNSQVVFDTIFELITDPNKIRKFVENRMKNDPLGFFDKHIPKNGMRKFQRLTLAKQMRIQFLSSGKIDDVSNLMASFLSMKSGEIPDLIKRGVSLGQLKTLRHSVVPPKRVKLYQNLCYEVVSMPNLYLGDSMVVLLVESNGEQAFKTVISEKERCVASFLPLNTNTALLGKVKDTSIDLTSFVDQIAPCSIDFFIADKNDANLRADADRIGTNNNLLTESRLDEIVESILGDQEFL